jgi:hypothetical protein
VKRLSDQTLYEILEVSVEAAPEEIERAYGRAVSLYAPGSLATLHAGLGRRGPAPQQPS